jgi:hypothetical protein
MAVYAPIVPNVPPWVYDRIETQGLTGVASSFRSLAASATEDGDNVSADAFTAWVSVIESSRNYPGTASGRSTIMHITKK